MLNPGAYPPPLPGIGFNIKIYPEQQTAKEGNFQI